MNTNEDAVSLYAELTQLIERQREGDVDLEHFYKQLHRLFGRLLNEYTQFGNARLVGTFAKLDYLLKEGEAPFSLRRHLNDVRVSLQAAVRHQKPSASLAERWQLDARGVCDLTAFLTGQPLPASLDGQLASWPLEEAAGGAPTEDRGRLLPCVRLLVDHWDGKYIYGTQSDDGVTEEKVCYTENAHYPFDWSYLQKLLRPGCQLNLVGVRHRQGVLCPELIIVHPDYLIDISQIAKCFATYAESPLVSLMERLAPNDPTEPILLGYMASQLLDEELHDMHRSYAETALDFFHQNAMDLLTTDLSPDFHARAQTQRSYIHSAVSVQLPLLAGKYQRDRVIVEPSFVSEMLGLQGRMDFLQTDMRILIEQKSGKAAFVPHDPTPDQPRPREEHYVQMLLYMAILRYNFSETYEKNHRQLHAFLMYSAYPNALVGLGFAPELLFRAVKMRNRLAAQDMYLAQRGFGFLGSLTSERLKEKNINDKLWQQWVRPRLEGVLCPIRQASELERKYCFRLLRFVAAEHQLSKLGSQTKENAGFAAIWHDSLEDKRQSGNIYDGLRLEWPTQRDGNLTYVERVALRFPVGQDVDTSNFRVGDVAVLYAYEAGTEPDARKHILYRGSIGEITSVGITFLLRCAQTDARVLVRDADKLWAIEHDCIESTNTALYRGVQSFLTVNKDRRDLLLFQRSPRIDATRTLKSDYGDFNELALRVKQACDLFLIIGPPGTGKTSYGMLYTLKEELQEEGSQVIVVSYTNRAVDEICSKLHGTVDFLRIGSEYGCAPEWREHLFSHRVKLCRNRAEMEQLLLRTRVFVGTTTSMSKARPLFALKSFSLAIVDEASQILEPALLALLSMQHDGECAIRKFVMIGDHKQLPAVVQQKSTESEVTDADLRAVGLVDCRLSLFERMLHRYANNKEVCYMLTRQGRMHPDISAFPNQAFYGGRLRVVPLPHQKEDSPHKRVTFFDVRPRVGEESDKVNQAEAEVVARQVEAIYERERDRFDALDTLGVIVPYRNQIATIRSAIARLGIAALQGITIDTVERYQGSQRRYIIYSFTVKHFYQLRFLSDSTFVEGETLIDRKLNVAMTRAKEYLLMTGNAPLLRNNAVFARLLDWVKESGGFFASDR